MPLTIHRYLFTLNNLWRFFSGYVYYRGQVLDQHGIWQRFRNGQKPTNYTPFVDGGSLPASISTIGGIGSHENIGSWVANHTEDAWIGINPGPYWPHICEYQGNQMTLTLILSHIFYSRTCLSSWIYLCNGKLFHRHSDQQRRHQYCLDSMQTFDVQPWKIVVSHHGARVLHAFESRLGRLCHPCWIG